MVYFVFFVGCERKEEREREEELKDKVTQKLFLMSSLIS